MFDEVHDLRNLGNRNAAASTLGRCATSAVCLTATPIITSILVSFILRVQHTKLSPHQNLINIGNVIGIKECEYFDQKDLDKKLRQARSADRRALVF